MILSALRLLRSLSGYHYRMIILTVLLPILLPTLFSLASSYFGLDLVPPILYIPAFLVFSLIVVLAVASMLKKDRSEAEKQVAYRESTLSSKVRTLEEGHEDLREDLWQQVNGLEELVRSTLSEELGVVLPRRPISLRMRATAGSPKASFSLTVDGGEQAGAPSMVVPTHDASVMGSGLRKAGSQLSCEC